MKKELTAVKKRIKKLKDRKALIDEELEPLFIRAYLKNKSCTIYADMQE